MRQEYDIVYSVIVVRGPLLGGGAAVGRSLPPGGATHASSVSRIQGVDLAAPAYIPACSTLKYSVFSAVDYRGKLENMHL